MASSLDMDSSSFDLYSSEITVHTMKLNTPYKCKYSAELMAANGDAIKIKTIGPKSGPSHLYCVCMMVTSLHML